MIKHIEIILYVNNQAGSRDFYKKILGMSPALDVPGMTEFVLSDTCKLGLMPNDGIAKILGNEIPHPADGSGIPRCELYLKVEDIEFAFNNAIESGAKLVSPVQIRNWGDRACYFSDPDGHIIAFAEAIGE